MRLPTRALPVILLVVLASSCSKGGDEQAVATVGDRVITVAQIEKTYSRVDPQYLPKAPGYEGRVEFLETMINKELMALKADELGYDKDPFVVQGMESFRKVGLTAGYLKVKVADKIVVNDEVLQDVYKHYGTLLYVKQILCDRLSEAEEVVALLEDGTDFESVCREYSKGPDAPMGGKRMTVTYGNFPTSIQDYIFEYKVGEYSKPLASRYGYFVFRIDEIVKRDKPPFDEIRDKLVNMTRAQQEMRLSHEMSDAIREKHNLQWYEDNLSIAFEALPPDRPLDDPPDRRDEIYPLLDFEPEDLDKPLVTYDDKAITIRDFSDMYDKGSFFARPRRQFRWGDIRKFLLDGIMAELVEKEVEEVGIEHEPEVAQLLQRKREQLMVNRLYNDLVDQQTEVTPREIDNYYNDNIEQFRRAEERRFLRIIVGDKATADDVARRARRGESFSQMAATVSISGDYEKDKGDTGFITKSNAFQYEKGFELRDVGDVTDPYENMEGWVVLKLMEKRPERVLTILEAQHEIRHHLKQQKNEERLNALLENWREETPVKIYEKNLKAAKLERAQKSSGLFSS